MKNIVLPKHIYHFFHILLLCAFATLPIIFTWQWLDMNTQLPTSDATDYIKSALQTYRAMSETGGVHELVRGFRPVFFPFLMLPTLLMTHGNVFSAFQMVVIMCLIASFIYVYLFLRLKLTHFSACIGASLIVLLPFIQTPLLTFFAEGALFPCMIGCLYHLMRADFFRDRLHTIGFIVCITLAFWIRPIEAITQLVFVLSAFLLLARSKHLVSTREMIQIFLISSLTVFILCFLIATHFINHYPTTFIDHGYYDQLLAKTIYHILIFSLACFLTLFFIFYYSGREKTEYNTSTVKTFIIINGLVLLWFGPYAFQTFFWVFRTSIGDIATIDAATRPWISRWDNLMGLIVQEGIILIAGTVVTGILAIIMIPKRFLQIVTSREILVLLLILPFPFWEVLNTIQNVPRKLSIAFPTLLIAFLMMGLQTGRGTVIRHFVILVTVMLQFGFTMHCLHTRTTPLASQWIGSYPAPVTIQPNPHDMILNFLAQVAGRNQLKKIAMEINASNELPVDTFLLHLMAMSGNMPFTIGYPYFSDFDTSNIQRIAKTSDAIFLCDRVADLDSSHAVDHYIEKFQQEKNPTHKTMYHLLSLYSQHRLDQTGWREGPCFLLTGVSHQTYRGCLLVLDKSQQAFKIRN